MATGRRNSKDFTRPARRIVVGILLVALVGLFLFWRIDSPRAERLRAQIVDQVVPTFDWALIPVTKLVGMVENFDSYRRIYEQNQDLRRELQRMKAWKEAALQLEQENAKLLDLNKVRLDPALTFITGVVLADSGSPFRQSVLLNIGARDGIRDGWAATDGLGLVGRVSGVGATSSRVILMTDSNSRVPVMVQPSGQRAILAGDNSKLPPLDFVEAPDAVRPGDRVVSSGDGGVLPAGQLVGQVVQSADGRLRVRLAADYERLEYLRVLRFQPNEAIGDPGGLVLPLALPAFLTNLSEPGDG
ncbi:rod shape-determining protein MreC [Palleronia aestuarii]|uniref:Cell shape-determining protein MreC n=1 Tax=Palleronia aestuarii TaxID=568105 RepID=A0A2W7NDF7_9RHOB|nr:rod shape-determining protein MreC [Palleronia aestuarii]PZX18425.1 rod shape-determining protein MreC [Palleronia aestuarii]